MTDLGRASRFLGLEIEYLPDGSIALSQKGYIKTVLQRFSLMDCTPVFSPMDPNVDLENVICSDSKASPSDRLRYLSMVGSLMYAAIGTRPDIAYSVTALSRYNQSPLNMHLTAARRVLRYLKGSINLSIIYRRDNDLRSDQVRIYSDSDWAGNSKDRKSIGGCAILAPGATGLINWSAKKQSVVALSTLEAEYIACSEATREALWLRQLMIDTKISTNENATEVFCDNQGALTLLKSGVIKAKTKHIAVKFHHVLDEVKRGSVSFTYVASKENVADVLTKPLNGPNHSNAIRLLGMETSP
jgi:hypothetical protein